MRRPLHATGVLLFTAVLLPILAGAGWWYFREQSLADYGPAFREYAYGELRYRMLIHQNPEEATRLLALAEEAVAERWKTYAEMATRGG